MHNRHIFDSIDELYILLACTRHIVAQLVYRTINWSKQPKALYHFTNGHLFCLLFMFLRNKMIYLITLILSMAEQLVAWYLPILSSNTGRINSLTFSRPYSPASMISSYQVLTQKLLFLPKYWKMSLATLVQSHI